MQHGFAYVNKEKILILNEEHVLRFWLEIRRSKKNKTKKKHLWIIHSKNSNMHEENI